MLSDDEVFSMLSEKGKDLKVARGYKYRFQRRMTSGVQRWICSSSKTCKAYLKLTTSGELVESNVHHDHNPESDAKIQKQQLNNTVKRKAVEDICERPSKVINRVLLEGDGECALTSQDHANIRRNVHHARSKEMPRLPTCLFDLHLALEAYTRTVTSKNENFLLVNDVDANIVMFGTAQNLRFLCSCESIFVDGTFRTAPKLFTQIFIVHGFKNSNYVPLLFCLLPDKAEKSYATAFHHILQESNKLSLFFAPAKVYADFEVSIHNAVSQKLVYSETRGCRFHLGQSWWRRIQKLGLAATYKENESEDGKFLKLLFGLPFLDYREVASCFTDDIMPLCPDVASIRTFAQYVFTNYIQDDSPFPPKMWAEYDATLTRTTNACESFNAKLNGMFYSAHPNIFKLLDALLEVQCEVYTKMFDVHRPRRRKDVLQKEHDVGVLMTRRETGDLSRLEFLRRVSFKFLPPPKT